MIIGLDAKRIVRNGTGLGSYGRNLANALAAIAPDDLQLRLYAPDAGRDDLRCQVAEGDHLSYVYPRHAWCKSLWRSHGIVSDLRRDGVDLFHGLSGELPIGIHASGIRSVVTIHDLIFMRHPEYYHWADVQIYAWKFRRTIAEADRIIAISECTKRDIMYYGHVPQERIEVIYQSCSTHFKTRESEARLQDIHACYLLPGRYIIHVGTVERRKNILLAVKALAHIDSDVSLVIVGRQTPYADKVKAYAEAHGLAKRVRWLTGVPNADLPSLYRGHTEWTSRGGLYGQLSGRGWRPRLLLRRPGRRPGHGAGHYAGAGGCPGSRGAHSAQPGPHSPLRGYRCGRTGTRRVPPGGGQRAKVNR